MFCAPFTTSLKSRNFFSESPDPVFPDAFVVWALAGGDPSLELSSSSRRAPPAIRPVEPTAVVSTRTAAHLHASRLMVSPRGSTDGSRTPGRPTAGDECLKPPAPAGAIVTPAPLARPV